MTPDKLLQECESLTHGGRMRRMVELGQLAATDAGIRATLEALAQGEVYQRFLALQACQGSRDAGHVLRALDDASRLVRTLALRLAALICDDEMLQGALLALPLERKRALAQGLGRHDRQAAVDRYLATLAESETAVLSALLPYSSREAVGRYFAQGKEKFDLLTLCRLARRHPTLMLEYLRSLAPRAQESIDPQLVARVNTLLPLLAAKEPDATLDLVKALTPGIPLARLQLSTLIRKRPNAMAELARVSGEEMGLAFARVVHRLDSEQLLALATHAPQAVIQRFSKLRPELRLELYTLCARGWRDSEGVLPVALVAALPGGARVEEGRRHLALPALATRPLEQFAYAAFLPWEDASALLNMSLRSPDAALRGAALKALLGVTRYQRTRLAEALQLARARRNEQDPVRREILTALADLPHSIWQDEHLEPLAQILKDAREATDLSYVTEQAMSRLIVSIFPFHPTWAAEQMAAIYRARGYTSIARLEKFLSDEHVRAIAPVLTPILRSWSNREQEGLLLVLASALGRRLRVFDELAELLEKIAGTTKNSAIADAALDLLRKHRHAHAAQLIPTLLRQDKSLILLSTVYTYLHEKRQDLLTPFLGQRAYRGRFSTGRVRFILPVRDGFERWTPTQQKLFMRTLLEVVRAKDQNRAVYEWLTVIRQIAAMPAVNFAPLIELAGDERKPVREAALHALGSLDAGQGVPTLLAALNDERARIAIYALRGALLDMPPAEALHLLRGAPLTQVTVAKEVVRLVGELGTEEAYRTLLSWEGSELHRDVRVALLRALWDYLNYPETWEIFAQAARTDDPALARGVVHIPVENLSASMQPRLAELTATLLAHPTSEVRIATLQWRALYPISDHARVLFARLLALLNSPYPDECKLAADALFAIYTGQDAALVGEALRDLLSQRRALHIICQAFAAALVHNRQRLQATTRTMLDALSQDRLTVTLRVEIIIAGLPWAEVAPELLKLAGSLHASALSKAWTSLQQSARRPDAHLDELETALAASPHEDLRYLALAALVAQSTQASGWSDEAVTRLQQYRADPSPLVAEAAQFTFEA